MDFDDGLDDDALIAMMDSAEAGAAPGVAPRDGETKHGAACAPRAAEHDHEHDELLARCRGFFEHAYKPEAFGGETAAADSSETHYRETRADDPPIVVLVPCTCVEPFDKSLRYLQQIGDLSDLDPNPYI